MNFCYGLDWRENWKGNYITLHPTTGQPVTAFRNKKGSWGGVWDGVFLSGNFRTAEEACEQLERLIAGEDVPTRKPK